MTSHEQINRDWSALASSWQSIDEHPTVAVQSLIERVHREERRLRIWHVVEIAFSAVVVLGTVLLLVIRSSTSSVVLAIDTWVVLGVVWFFALASDRGLSVTAALSTTEYLALAHRHAMRRLHTAYLALALLLGQVIVLLALMVNDRAYRDVSNLQVVSVIAWLAWAAWGRRKALADLDDLRQLGRDLHP